MDNIETSNGRPGLQVAADHPLVCDLNALAVKHGLAGCVLIAFDVESDRVSTTAGGTNPGFVEAGMMPLADELLARIDNGEFDPK
ncbi:hypothetical protein [Pseudomonas aeruginosa]|uniref:hypothetical protein n=1 Tax=Pseudomonas aeruginosa TaxID=287 RepID=UPI000708E1D3|nr:hypothetical protein [Pseudomonas aeruginosa]